MKMVRASRSLCPYLVELGDLVSTGWGVMEVVALDRETVTLRLLPWRERLWRSFRFRGFWSRVWQR